MSAPTPDDITSGDLFLNEGLSDVIITVGTGSTIYRLPCHASVLSSASDVWKTKLNSVAWQKSGKKEIEVKDVDAETFVDFLRFVYKQELTASPWTEVLNLLQISIRYTVPQLKEACQRRLMESLSLQNYARLLSTATQFDLPALKWKCLEMVLVLGGLALESEEFLRLDREWVEKIISSGDLQVFSEFMVVRALWRWARMDCCRRGVPVSEDSMVKILGDMVRNINQLSLTDIERASVPRPLLLRIHGAGRPAPRLLCREGFAYVHGKLLKDFETRIVIMSDGCLDVCSSKQDISPITCATFTLDRPVFLLGLKFCSSEGPCASINIVSELPTGESKFYDVSYLTSFQPFCSPDVKTTLVHCKHSVNADSHTSVLKLDAGKKYSIQSSSHESHVVYHPSVIASDSTLIDIKGSISLNVCSKVVIGIQSFSVAPVIPSTFSPNHM